METNKKIEDFILKLKVKNTEPTLKSNIMMHINDMNNDELNMIYHQIISIKKHRNLCPVCEQSLIHENSCERCVNCGYTSCEL